jgi:hypothetical protein
MADATRARAETAVAALGIGAADHDRSVLIVRQLQITAEDREQARAELATARQHAARASLGPADPAAESVLFADEAEMLACLTRDVAAGRRPWYWQHVLPRGAEGAGAGLAAAWIARARWLPAAFALLTAEESVAALRQIAPVHLRQVLGALVTEFAVPGPVPTGDGAEPATPGPGATLISDQVAKWPADAASAGGSKPLVAGSPEAVRPAQVEPRSPLPVLPGPATGLPEVARALLGLALALGRPRQDPDSRPQPLASQPPPGLEARPGPPASHQAPRQMEGSTTSGGQPPEGALVAARSAGEPDARPDLRGNEPGDARGTAIPAATDVSSWDPAFATSVASALYVVNLVSWLAIPRPGWATVELLARHILDGQLDQVADDPLWDMLAVLDERERGTAAEPSADFAEIAERVDALLAAHELSMATFRHAGRIALTRTHLDVLLWLDDADLAARRCGLDHDPGWVPSLRRIVAFHFLGGQELQR